ncbi:hypothetical protein EON63_11585 [archaeon]|nr:MAG: hypothetical protein EON63_11585 [archaeon]
MYICVRDHAHACTPSPIHILYIDICSPHTKDVYVPHTHISSPPIHTILAAFNKIHTHTHTHTPSSPVLTEYARDDDVNMGSDAHTHTHEETDDMGMDVDYDMGDGVGCVKQKLEKHLVHILNTASYEEVSRYILTTYPYPPSI